MKRLHTISKACSICGGPLSNSSTNKRKNTKGFGVCYSCKKKTPTEYYRCKGTNSRGKQCGHWRSNDSDFCAIHERHQNPLRTNNKKEDTTKRG